MSSEDMGLVSSQRLENGLGSHHHIVFQDDDALRFNCGAPAAATQRRVRGDPSGVPKTRDLNGFIDERFFAATPTASSADFRRGIYRGDRRDPPEPRNWTGEAAAASVDGSDEDEEEDDDDDDEEDDDVDDVVVEGRGSDGNNASDGGDKIGNGKQKGHSNNTTRPHHQHHFGVNVMVGSSSRDVVVNESGAPGTVVAVVPKASPQQPGSNNNNNNQNVVTVAENDGGGGGDSYFSHFFQGAKGSSAAGQKDLGAAENGCGFSGRKDGCSYSNESLRAILSDPVTGALMDDAMILPCGHSFGGGGIQHVIRMKSCYTCSQSISEDSAAPNLSLRAAVQAFRREEELQFQRSAKRKRERFDQEKGIYGDSILVELPRGRGVQFPFAVTDRVIIKGNKRTPQRFVGREAVVTTQCLNGWYVVKTLDNAESVKLQYRSLAKVPDDPLPKPISSKMAPNWL